MKENSGEKKQNFLVQSVYGCRCIRFSQVTLNPVSGACCTCFLALIIVWIEKLKTEAKAAFWVSLYVLLSVSPEKYFISTTFDFFLFSDFLFTGCEWQQVATTGRFFCSCSGFAFSCTCVGSAAHDCMSLKWCCLEILGLHL